MMRQITSINWRYIGDAVPAFVTVMFIPFGYSAAYGLIAGLMVYTALNGMIYLTKVISGGYIVPDDEDHREYWTSKFYFFFLPIYRKHATHHTRTSSMTTAKTSPLTLSTQLNPPAVSPGSSPPARH